MLHLCKLGSSHQSGQKVYAVSLIPKPGNLTDPMNWRPIMQTSVFSKLFEKLIYERLYDHLDT